MEASEVFWEIGTSVSIGGLVIGAIAWVARATIRWLIERDTESFKYELQLQVDRELAEIRHALQIAAITHEQTAATLADRRADVITTFTRS